MVMADVRQYETWIQDRPSRSDHYRRAISVIATAPGEERPALRAYLEGKDSESIIIAVSDASL